MKNRQRNHPKGPSLTGSASCPLSTIIMPTAISTTTTTSTTISENINNSAHRSLSASSSRRARPSSVRIQNSSHSPNDKSSAKSALRTLYDKAKHAFLQRDLVTADKLLNQAFLQLPPPPLSHSQPGTRDIDGLDSQRRKWDILRITLWTTLFVSRGDGSDKTSCPVHLAPYQFLQKLHSNSLRLFTPTTAQESSSRQAQGDEEFTANIGNVPDQVVFLLIVSALKLDELRVAKEWIEDWLVRRDPSSTSDSPPNTTVDGPNGKEQMTSYEKIVDVYVLHVLPRLGLWDDATEFLRYETEMNESVKQVSIYLYFIILIVSDAINSLAYLQLAQCPASVLPSRQPDLVSFKRSITNSFPCFFHFNYPCCQWRKHPASSCIRCVDIQLGINGDRSSWSSSKLQTQYW